MNLLQDQRFVAPRMSQSPGESLSSCLPLCSRVMEGVAELSEVNRDLNNRYGAALHPPTVNSSAICLGHCTRQYGLAIPPGWQLGDGRANNCLELRRTTCWCVNKTPGEPLTTHEPHIGQPDLRLPKVGQLASRVWTIDSYVPHTQTHCTYFRASILS